MRERHAQCSRRRSICDAGLKLSFAAPEAGDAAFDEYISDPAKPVPFRARPIQPMGYEQRQHLAAVAGGRSARGLGRPDVVAFISES